MKPFIKTENVSANGLTVTGTFKKNPEFQVTVPGSSKVYTQDSPEVYAVLLTNYVPKGEMMNGNNFLTFMKLKVVKFTDGNSTTTPQTAKAIPTASKVFVNGKQIVFDAYTINGYNYFKLKDFAYVVRGTTKQFDVTWVEAQKVINLTSNKAYTVTGGELKIPDGIVKTGTININPIYKDGALANLEAYTINGNNHFKLKDLGRTFNISVWWDNATQSILIDTNKDFIEQ